VSARLRQISGPRLIKLLQARGWYVKRIRGSHHVLRHPEVPDTLVVPVHGNQPPEDRDAPQDRRDEPQRTRRLRVKARNLRTIPAVEELRRVLQRLAAPYRVARAAVPCVRLRAPGVPLIGAYSCSR